MFIEQRLVRSRFSWHTHLFVKAKQEGRSRVLAQVSDCYEQTSQVASTRVKAKPKGELNCSPFVYLVGTQRFSGMFRTTSCRRLVASTARPIVWTPISSCCRAFPRLFDRDSAISHTSSIQSVNGSLCFLGVAHFHKR